MTDPALDGPDAEAALLTAIYGIGCEDPSADAETLLHALNEQGVVLCDEHALAELRQQAKAGKAFIDAIRELVRTTNVHWADVDDLLVNHGLGRPK